jgi:hypothetical protein
MRRNLSRAVSADRVIVTTAPSADSSWRFGDVRAGRPRRHRQSGYPPYRHILTALGCEPVLIETDAANRFAITGESLRAAHRRSRSPACWSQARPIRPAP